MDRYRLKKPKIFTGVLFALFLIGISVAMISVTAFNKTDYEKDGEKVQCTVYYYEKFLKHYDVRVEYQNDNGETIQAQLVMRGFPPSYNQTLDGYVMPDEPYKVYQESNIILVIIMYAMILLFFAGGVFMLWAAVTSVTDYRLLKAIGKSCTGEIVEVTMEKDNKGKLFYPAKYIYTDDDGNQQTGQTVFDRRPPDNGDRFTVIYARKKNGKYVSEMIH